MGDEDNKLSLTPWEDVEKTLKTLDDPCARLAYLDEISRELRQYEASRETFSEEESAALRERNSLIWEAGRLDRWPCRKQQLTPELDQLIIDLFEEIEQEADFEKQLHALDNGSRRIRQKVGAVPTGGDAFQAIPDLKAEQFERIYLGQITRRTTQIIDEHLAARREEIAALTTAKQQAVAWYREHESDSLHYRVRIIPLGQEAFTAWREAVKAEAEPMNSRQRIDLYRRALLDAQQEKITKREIAGPLLDGLPLEIAYEQSVLPEETEATDEGPDLPAVQVKLGGYKAPDYARDIIRILKNDPSISTYEDLQITLFEEGYNGTEKAEPRTVIRQVQDQMRAIGYDFEKDSFTNFAQNLIELSKDGGLLA